MTEESTISFRNFFLVKKNLKALRCAEASTVESPTDQGQEYGPLKIIRNSLTWSAGPGQYPRPNGDFRIEIFGQHNNLIEHFLFSFHFDGYGAGYSCFYVLKVSRNLQLPFLNLNEKLQ